MRSLGIDLAAQPRTTAAVLIRWPWSVGVGAQPVVEQARVGCTDEDLRDLARRCAGDGDRVGVDCPLGWPLAFVELVTSHAAGEPSAVWQMGVAEATRHLRYRLTDLDVWDRVGHAPISVSTDKLGSTALRASRLVQQWEADRGHRLARDGSGWLVEVYPAAARRCWALDHVARDPEALLARLPAIEVDDVARSLLAANEHVFDALVAALVARAAHLGSTRRPPPEVQQQVDVEGWIHLPDDAHSLEALAGF